MGLAKIFLVALIASGLYTVRGQANLNCGGSQSGNIVSVTCTPDFTVTTLSCTLDGVALTSCDFPVEVDTSTLSPGTHSLVFTGSGTSSGGRNVRVSSTINIGTSAQLRCSPAVTGNTLQVTCSAAGVQIQSSTCSFDSMQASPCAIPGNFDLTTFSTGTHTLDVNAIVAGTGAVLMSGTINFLGAVAQANFNCDALQRGNIVSVTDCTSHLTVTAITCTLDGVALASCDFPVEVDTSTLSPGQHALVFTGTGTLSDGRNIRVSATINFEVSTQLQCSSVISGNTLQVTCSAAGVQIFQSFNCSFDSMPASPCAIPGNFDLTPFSAGTHTLVVNAIVAGTGAVLMSGTITFFGAIATDSANLNCGGSQSGNIVSVTCTPDFTVDTLTCTLDGVALTSCDFPVEVDTSTLSPGTHSLVFTATGTLSDGRNVRVSSTINIGTTLMCPDPAPIANGIVIVTGNSIGDFATYLCNSGFELIGSTVVNCTQLDLNTAAFVPSQPVCRPLCPDPHSPSFGHVEFFGNSVGDIAFNHCPNRYNLFGNSIATCTQVDAGRAEYLPGPPECLRTTFERLELTCTAVQISPSSNPDVSCFINTGYTGLHCSFDSGDFGRCNISSSNGSYFGYSIDQSRFSEGSHTVTTHVANPGGDSDRETNSFTVPPALVLTCGVMGPPTVFNCDASNAPFVIQCQYDSGPFFLCNLPLRIDPFLPPGPHTLTVEYTDAFEQTSEQTISFNVSALMCPVPALIDNGVLTFTGNSIGDNATYCCDSGFELIGSTVVTCTQLDVNTAAFVPSQPVCRLIPVDIGLRCRVTPSFAETIYSYSCRVFPGSGQQDTLVCAVDDVTFVPCLLMDDISVFDFAPGRHIASITVNDTLGSSARETFIFFSPDAIRRINFECSFNPFSFPAIISYVCEVIYGELDTVMCTVDDVPIVPCQLINEINVFDFALGDHEGVTIVNNILGSSFDVDVYHFTTPEAVIRLEQAVYTVIENEGPLTVCAQISAGSPSRPISFSLRVLQGPGTAMGGGSASGSGNASGSGIPMEGSCVDAGFTDCCRFFGCEIRSGDSSCFCNQRCFILNDCCSDILDVPCFPAFGSASGSGFGGGADFIEFTVDLTFDMNNANELLCEDIEIIDDTLVEGAETFYAVLDTTDPDVVFATQPPGVVPLLAPGFSRIFILDDESPPRPIELTCLVFPTFIMTVYIYSCIVIPGSGQQDALVCTVDGVPSVQCLLEDEINVFDFAPGNHTATITVNDTLGFTDSESFTFFTRGTAIQPIDLECLLVSNDAMTIFSYACKVDPGDGQQDTLVCTVDGVPRVPCLLVDDLNVFDFAPGDHTATITVTDTLGTSASESFTFTTPDNICSTVTGGVGVRLECPGSEDIPDVDEILCSLDGGDFFECNPPSSITALPEGPHSFVVVARRADGTDFPVGQSQFVIDGLDLYFINDTPQVDGTGSLRAQFRTNRPGPDVILTCRLVGRSGPGPDNDLLDLTQDCTNGSVNYDGLPLADFVLRVTADDTVNGAVAVIRSGLWIPGNNDFCTITAINRRVTVFGNNATIEFGNTGNPNGFHCRLDRQQYEPCSSPVTVTNLGAGQHQLRIRPAGCGRPGVGHRSISVKFEV